MANPSKAKGTAAESAVVKYAREHGFPDADRLTLTGSFDRGDVRIDAHTMVEVKAGRQAQEASLVQIHKWIDETKLEWMNGGWASAFLVTQRRGLGIERVGLWDAWLWEHSLPRHLPCLVTVRLHDALVMVDDLNHLRAEVIEARVFASPHDH